MLTVSNYEELYALLKDSEKSILNSFNDEVARIGIEYNIGDDMLTELCKLSKNVGAAIASANGVFKEFLEARKRGIDFSIGTCIDFMNGR